MSEPQARLWRFPVLLVEDREGIVTGRLAGCADRGLAAIGGTEKEVLAQIRSALMQARDGTLGEPWYAEPQLEVITVSVRPRIMHDGRAYVAHGSIPVRLACVWGKLTADVVSCEIPQLGLDVDLVEGEDRWLVVSQAVRNALETGTPRAVLRLRNSARFRLGEVRLTPPETNAGAESASARTAELARVGEPVPSRSLRPPSTAAFGREDLHAALLERIVEAGANVLLVGPPGVGKSSLLIDLAAKADARLPRPQGESRAPRFWWTSGSRLVAGMVYLGEWQARCDRVVAELADVGGFLCLDNLMGLVSAAGCAPEAGPGAYLQSYLESGALRILTECTPAEWEACRRVLPGLAARFEVFRLPPLERVAVRSVLERIARDRGTAASVEVDPRALDRVQSLFARFLPYEAPPGRVAAFLADRLDPRRRPVRGRWTADDAVRAFSADTGLPEVFLRDETPLDPAEVETWFRRRVMGQEVACREAAGVVTVFKAGLNDPARPIANLLFAGPTGVGKTELAKALAARFFGEGARPDPRLVRLDMSEYGGPDAAARLLGDPDGAAPSWIARVRRQPFCVVLFDEIEKASGEVFDVLLGLLDEGRLTDAYGRATVFRSAVIVLTSNLGGARPDSLGFATDRGPDYEAEVRAFFRPEFFNRLDRVVRFEPLSPQAVQAIVHKELGEIGRREGVVKRRLRLTWTDALVRRLAERGFDPRYGARPLQRVLEDAVVAPLGRFLLAHPRLLDCGLEAALGDDASAVFRPS